jgi:ATP-dependent DNA ligase
MDAIGDTIGLVRIASGTDDKTALLQEVIDISGEGVMFRLKQGHYQPAKRSSSLIKYKLVNEADCLVTAAHPTKESVTLSVFNDDGDLIEVGQASTIGKTPTPTVGSVWETKFQYVMSAETPRMVQPRLSRIRDDKSPGECQLIQFATCVTDKSVQQSHE